jgi:glycosyltransferase involved in cell wall biosynthesis
VTELVVDMTPTVISRTAIYHIAQDTFAALPPEARRVQYRGEVSPRLITDKATQKKIAEAFLQDVAKFSEQDIHTEELRLFAAAEDRSPRLFFDPLYTLYGPLSARDVVFVLDMTTLTNPEWHEPHIVRLYQRTFRKLAASPAKIVSISRHTTDSLRATFAIPSTDIITVPLYVRPMVRVAAEAPESALVPGKFLLFVGSLESRKNLTGLADAFELSGLADEGYALAIAGGPGRGSKEITRSLTGSKGVHLLGFVSDGELRWLYENALGFAYPSHLEGFGVPLIEAMSFGLPCLAPTTGAPPEICGELGILADPNDLSEITDALRKLVGIAESASGSLREALRARAAEYSFAAYMAELQKALPTDLGDATWKG